MIQLMIGHLMEYYESDKRLTTFKQKGKGMNPTRLNLPQFQLDHNEIITLRAMVLASVIGNSIGYNESNK